MRRKGLTTLVLCLMTIVFFPMYTVYAEYDKTADYSTMALIAQPERLENVVMPIYGYIKFEKEGMIVYLGKEDYIYDTKENAVWFPQRQERTLEERWQQGKPQDGSRIGLTGIIQPKREDSPYAAEALYYIDDGDTAYQNAKEQPSRTELYDRENEKEQAQRISIYRLLGDPWTYDGKKVCVADVVDKQESGLMPLRNGELPVEMLLISTVNGEDIGNYVDAWKPLIAAYTSNEPYQGLNSEGRRYCVEMGAYIKHVRMEMEMMFYMHDPIWYYKENGTEKSVLEGIQYSYWPCLVQINQKDIEEFKAGMMECYYMVKDKYQREQP